MKIGSNRMIRVLLPVFWLVYSFEEQAFLLFAFPFYKYCFTYIDEAVEN